MKYKRLLATCSLIPTLASSMFCYSAAQVSAAAPESTIYNTLETNAEKELYDSLYDECLEINGSESDFERTDFCSYDVSLSASRVKEVVWLFVFDHPEFFWLDGSLKRSLTSDSASVSLGILDDYKSGQERNKAKQKLYDAEKVYLDKADTYSTDYEKVKYFHDTLIKNVEYTENELDQSAISALVNNKTVCAGYTKAFKLLCDDSGIDCIAVQGYSHSWNKCYIDGNWYNVDVTNDDQKNMNYFCFLTSDDALDNLDKMSKVIYNITVSSDGVEQNINVYMHTLDSTNFPHYYDKYPAAPTSFDMDSFHMFGDANDDGLINSSDATAMLIDYAYSIVEGKSLLSAEVSDINGDGSIDSKDATIILIYYARSMVDDSTGSLKNFVESKNY